MKVSNLVSSVSKSSKYILKFIIPYNLVILSKQWRQEPPRWETLKRPQSWETLKKELFAIGWLNELQQIDAIDFSYKEAINYLVNLDYESLFEAKGELGELAQSVSGSRGIIPGSIPESSLDFCSYFIGEYFTGQPLIGLHVGNFVGISLAFLTNVVKQLHDQSIIVSIDPNVKHRGIRNPLNLVVGLLNKFGLQDNCLILTGYSLEMNSYYDAPSDNNLTTNFFDRGMSCAQQLKGLEMISPATFDFFLIDGNHESNYLKREIESANKLLKSGGLLLLDDIDEFWGDLQETYESIDETKYQKLGTDGRVGVLKKVF